MAFCTSCGRPVQEEDLYCAGCGKKINRDAPTPSVPPLYRITEDLNLEEQVPAAPDPPDTATVEKPEPVKKKSLWKRPWWYLILAAVTAAAVLTALFLPVSITAPYEDMNRQGLAYFTYSPDRVFMITRQKDSGLNGNRIISQNYDGTDKTILLDKEDIQGIYYHEDKVYYSRKDEDKGMVVIGCIRADGTGKDQTLYKRQLTEAGVRALAFRDDRMYFLNNYKLVSTTLIGGSEQTLSSNKVVTSFLFQDDDTILYAGTSGIYAYTLSTGREQRLYTGEADNLILYKEYLYFTKLQGPLCRLKLEDGAKVEVLGGDQVGSYVIFNDTLIFIDQFDQQGIETYVRENLYDGSAVSQSLGELYAAGMGEIFQMELDGANKREVKNDPYGSSLYVSPEKVYSSLMDTISPIEPLIL